MICLTPQQIKNPNFGKAGERDRYLLVPCRKCTSCIKKRATEWIFRLKQEKKRSTTSAFITYTYDQENVPRTENGLPSLVTTDHTLYMKRLRKAIKKEGYSVKLKYYMVGEYGGETNRPHYHSIMFNVPQLFLDNPHRIEKAWKKGIVQVDKCEDAAIAYVTGYVQKKIEYAAERFAQENNGLVDDRVREFSRMSHNLGLNFLTEARTKKILQDLSPTIRVENGTHIALPKYYQNKLVQQEKLTKVEVGLISDKKRAYAEKNPTFESEKHRVDYIKADQRKTARHNKNSRNNV